MEGRLSRGQTGPNTKGSRTPASKKFWDPLPTPIRCDQIQQSNTWGEFLGVTYAPAARGRGPSAPQFGGFSLTHAYTV